MDPNTLVVVEILGACAVAVCIDLLAIATDMAARRRSRRLAGAETLELGLSESSKRLGLHLKRYRGGKRLGLSGRLEGSQVAVEFLWREEGDWATTVTLVPQPPLPHDVWFARAGPRPMSTGRPLNAQISTLVTQPLTS